MERGEIEEETLCARLFKLLVVGGERTCDTSAHIFDPPANQPQAQRGWRLVIMLAGKSLVQYSTIIPSLDNVLYMSPPTYGFAHHTLPHYASPCNRPV